MAHNKPVRADIPAHHPAGDAWEAIVDAEVAAAPPLRPEQIARLSALFDCQPGDVG